MIKATAKRKIIKEKGKVKERAVIKEKEKEIKIIIKINRTPKN